MKGETIVLKGFTWIGMILLMITVSSQVYNVNILCGTCSSKTGCVGNMCLKYTGDVSQEYCYGQSTCSSFSIQTAVTLSECIIDQSGGICQSGLCMSSSTVQICYGNQETIGACADGITIVIKCQNRIMTNTYYGGVWYQLYGSSGYTFNMTINQDCPFTSGTINRYSCLGDGLGNFCTCCSTSNFQGLVSSYGTCVSSNSPIVQVKSAMKSKYGSQFLLSLVLILFQIVLILF